MDFTLKVFYTVAKYKSFSRASEVLFLTQPTISFHIKKIEKELEVQLFERKNNKIFLTEAGRILYDYVEHIFIEYDRVKNRIASISTDVKGTIRVGVASLISQHLFPKILGAFKESNPNINIIMLIGDSQELINKLQMEEIDFAIVSEPVNTKNYQVIHFFNDKIVPVINPSHEWADKEYILIDDLFTKPLVSREEGSGGRKIFEKHLKLNNFNPQSLIICCTLGSTEAVKAAVINGMGYGVISRIAIQDELDRKIIKVVKVKGFDIIRKFLIIFNSEKQENKRFKEFLEFIINNPENKCYI